MWEILEIFKRLNQEFLDFLKKSLARYLTHGYYIFWNKKYLNLKKNSFRPQLQLDTFMG